MWQKNTVFHMTVEIPIKYQQCKNVIFFKTINFTLNEVIAANVISGKNFQGNLSLKKNPKIQWKETAEMRGADNRDFPAMLRKNAAQWIESIGEVGQNVEPL